MLASPPRTADEVVLHPRLYIERVAFVPPPVAQAAFDLFLDLRAEGATDSARYRFPAATGELVLVGPVRTPVPPTQSAVFPVRVVDGWIASRSGVYRMRVELELLRWSDRASALGLRPLGHRHHPLGFGPYLRIGGLTMTTFRDEVEAWARAGAGVRST
jgi:hypothetical protein